MRRGRMWLLPVGVCVVVLVWALLAHRGTRVLSACEVPPDVRYKSIPAWSADGRRAAVLGRSGDRRLGLVLDTSTGQPQVLRCYVLPNDLRVHPALDASGARLFYVAGSDKDPRIWSATITNGQTQQVAHGAWPMPAPVGHALAYLGLDSTSPASNLRVTQGRGAGSPVSSTIPFALHAAWSPDGKRIAYTGRQGSTSQSTDLAEVQVVAVASLSGGIPREEVVPGTGGTYPGIGWINSTSVAFAVVQKNAADQDVFAVTSYDLAAGTARQILPLSASQVLATYSPVWVSDGARQVFWQAPPDQGGTYYLANLTTGRSTIIQFPEQVDPGLSADGSRVLAVGVETGSLYLASPMAQGGEWQVMKLQLG